jgi:hypothetical protein
MSCQSCASLNEKEFATELMIHLNGPLRVDDRGVIAFTKVSVCMDCGAARFNTPDAKLRELRDGIAPAA